MLGMSVESPPVTDIKPTRRLTSWQHVILLAILLLAAILRFWGLDSWPPGLHHDEAYNGLDALSLLNRETFPLFYEGWELYAQDIHLNRPIYQTTFPPFFEGNYGREPLTIYLSTGAIALFGPTPFAVRFVPALAGILAVLATYLAAKVLSKSPGQATDEGAFSQQEAFSNLTPLVAAFAMAVLYPAITYSRYGDRAMIFVPIAAFTVYCFWRGIEAAEARRISELESGIAPPIPLGGFCAKVVFYWRVVFRTWPLCLCGRQVYAFIDFGLRFSVVCARSGYSTPAMGKSYFDGLDIGNRGLSSYFVYDSTPVLFNIPLSCHSEPGIGHVSRKTMDNVVA